jgi:hypothetical protein
MLLTKKKVDMHKLRKRSAQQQAEREIVRKKQAGSFSSKNVS